MNAGPQPIETRYKGFRFRSRLEARWAVYFDCLGIAWEYEPEGFKLPSGEMYLPDFFLPDGDVGSTGRGLFVEIKAQTRECVVWDVPAGLPKCSGLATPDIPLVLICGMPDDNTCFLFAPETGVAGLEDNGICLHGWRSGGCHAGVTMAPLTRREKMTAWGLSQMDSRPRVCMCPLACETKAVNWADAARAAKSARFEHGESG